MTVSRHLLRLQTRIETLAEQHSQPGERGVHLDDTLAGLDLIGRRRVIMLLEMVRAFSTEPDERTAADHIHVRATSIWHGSARRDQAAERLPRQSS